jgi:hypothetical protein
VPGQTLHETGKAVKDIPKHIQDTVGGESNAIQKPFKDLSDNIGKQFGPCPIGKKADGTPYFTVPIPCWAFYLAVILGFVVLIKH